MQGFLRVFVHEHINMTTSTKSHAKAMSPFSVIHFKPKFFSFPCEKNEHQSITPLDFDLCWNFTLKFHLYFLPREVNFTLSFSHFVTLTGVDTATSNMQQLIYVDG